MIIACALNTPDSMHTSLVVEWGGLYRKLVKYYQHYGGRCVVDSAFSRSNYFYLIKSAQDEGYANGHSEIIILIQVAAVRQASE